MTYKKISPKELHERIQEDENLIVLDVRAEEKYHDFHLAGLKIDSRNINKTEIFGLEETNDDTHLSLPKDREIVVTCTTGNSATKCANVLGGRGYTVLVLEGGLTAWQEYSSSLEEEGV